MLISTRIRLRPVCVITAAILVGILIHGSAMAQIPVKPTVEPEPEPATAQERFSRGVQNIGEAPWDITATVSDRFNGKRPRLFGLGILMSPVEGLTRCLTRFVMGFGGVLTSPYAEGDAMMYEYEHGTSVIDPALHKVGRGLYNIVKGPVDIPAAIVKRSSGERPRYYGYAVASSPFEGAGQGIMRAGMGLLEAGLAPFPPYDVPFYEYDLGASIIDPALGKAGFGLYHIASSPLDIPGAIMRRVNGEKSAHSGFAVAVSPLEGVVQGITRSAVGAYYTIASPFPYYPTEPPYQYAFGLSPIDKGIEGFMRGGENVEISPLELPITARYAMLDRGLLYGSAYSLVMGPTRMLIRLGAGLFEMVTCGAPSLEPIYEVGLSEEIPEMFQAEPRLKRPVYEPLGPTQQ